MVSTNPARGMRDFLPSDVRKREYVIGIIKEVYESYGFEPLETPAVENLETLTGKYGEEGNQLIFKILKRGEKLTEELAEFRELGESENSQNTANSLNSLSDLALRYDLTVPLARVVANNKNELPKFFKRYQIQPVWRADRPARGRFREFYQCDVDAIGSNSMVVEAELISAVCQIFVRLGFGDFVVRINHRRFLDCLLNSFEVPYEKRSNVLIAIDKLDKVGIDGVSDELSLQNVPEAAALKLLNHFKSVTDNYASLRNIQRLNPTKLGDANRQFNEKYLLTMKELSGEARYWEYGLDDLSDLLKFLGFRGDSGRIRIDSTLVRGLSYYTGTIMEINVPDLAGSLGGGGRYDGLIGMFGKEQIPACGFSLGLERILVVMEERGMFPPEIADSTPADVMVTIWSEETIGESLKLANELRQAGFRVTLYPEADKLGKQIRYADSIKVPFVCVLGESELAEGKVTIKNMKSGEQQPVARNQLSSEIFSE